MKAIKTRHLIEAFLNQLLKWDDHFDGKEVMFAHENAALNELEELERLAKIGKEYEDKHDIDAIRTSKFVSEVK